jgi:flavorubredoxin
VAEPFSAIKISEHVYWVGAIDWSIRDFHGYLTPRGSTYNAYLILSDPVTLVDTVKAPFREEMLSRIASVVEPGKIRYVISNHSEMDHSGSLPEVIRLLKPEKVFASVMGTRALKEHFHLDREIIALKDGESLNLGKLKLTFLETRMLHWPDSMITYLHDDALLFSQDGFGMHLASSERFADQIPADILAGEAASYFANILLLYSPLILKLLERVGKLNLPIKIIAPDHGPVYRQNLDWILQSYARWAARKPTGKAVVVYDTMWQSTEKMARAIGEGLAAGGAGVKLLSLKSSHRSDVATEILDAGALLVGSPTLNNGLFPTVADCLTYLKGLRPQNLTGAAFGSYGWSGESVGEIEGFLQAMKIPLAAGGLKVKYVPDREALEKCFSLGKAVAEKIKDQ